MSATNKHQLLLLLLSDRIAVLRTYCYQASSMVCRSVTVTLVSPAKTAASIQMQFGLRTLVSPRNHVLDEVQIPPWEGAILRGGKGHPIVKCKV